MYFLSTVPENQFRLFPVPGSIHLPTCPFIGVSPLQIVNSLLFWDIGRSLSGISISGAHKAPNLAERLVSKTK
jgi:hypothetical protein